MCIAFIVMASFLRPPPPQTWGLTIPSLPPASLSVAGMRDLTQAEWDRMTGTKRANTQSDRYPKMLPETKKMLEEFYAPYNKRLAELLKDDR